MKYLFALALLLCCSAAKADGYYGVDFILSTTDGVVLADGSWVMTAPFAAADPFGSPNRTDSYSIIQMSGTFDGDPMELVNPSGMDSEGTFTYSQFDFTDETTGVNYAVQSVLSPDPVLAYFDDAIGTVLVSDGDSVPIDFSYTETELAGLPDPAADPPDPPSDPPTDVPEPSTLWLLSLGFLALGARLAWIEGRRC